MYLKPFLLPTFFLLLFYQTILGQRKSTDSLQNKSFEYLRQAFEEHEENQEVSTVYVNAWIKKAKRERDTFNLAYAYLHKSYVLDYQYAISYSDSIINLTKEYKNDEFPALGYMLSGYHHYVNGKDKKAIELYLTAFDYALENNNVNQLVEIKQFIGTLHFNLGNYKEALKVFKNQFLYFEGNPNIKIKYISDYLITLDDLSKSYLRGKILDSALAFTEKGIDASLNYRNDEMYHRFLLNSGATYYFMEDFEKAIDSLNKVKPKLSGHGLAICLYYKAKIYQNKDIKEAMPYFRKVDSIYQETQNSFIELRDVYKTMFDYYSSNGTNREQIQIIKKLIKIDSIIDVDFKYINNSIIKDYEIPKLRKEKEKLELELIERDMKSELTIILLISFLLLCVLLMFLFYRKQKLYKKRFERVINKEETAKTNLKNSKSLTSISELNVSEEIISQILKKLETFESEYHFTKNDITLNKLSRDFNTNTSYLSKVINHYKKESFSNYLNNLRIDFAIKELKNNKLFRNYTIAAISEETGFNNPESFSKAFYKKTGIYPSYFIKQLEQI